MKTIFRSLFIILALSAGATSAAADGRVEFILDGSGSMWGDAGGEPKVTAAKRVMKDLLQRIELPADTTVGLTLYGHRRKGDCADIERLGPVEYGNRNSLAAAVAALNPKGKTPIADSLKLVGESLKGQEGATSIILVSDGIESCGKDPCAVAKALRDQYGIKVVIHVVGFDVREGQEQLQCIAKAGGGEYRVAVDAAGLAKELGEIKTVVQEAAKPRIVTMAASPLSAIVVKPLTLEGFPRIEEIYVLKPRARRDWPALSPVTRSKVFDKKMIVAAGTYDIAYKAAGTGSRYATVLVAGLEVPRKKTVTVHMDNIAAAITVPKMEGIDHKGIYVVGAGARRDSFGVITHGGYYESAKDFGTVMMVTAGRPYDVLLDLGDDSLVPIAEKVTPKGGELLVVQ